MNTILRRMLLGILAALAIFVSPTLNLFLGLALLPPGRRVSPVTTAEVAR